MWSLSVILGSNDEELAKWNLDDERKALEVEMEEEEKALTIDENHTNSVDFSIEVLKSTHPNREEREELLHWDDTSSTVSSVLPAGQGDPTGQNDRSGRKNSGCDGRMTPFSKLIKSGLLDSASKSEEPVCKPICPLLKKEVIKTLLLLNFFLIIIITLFNIGYT